MGRKGVTAKIENFHYIVDQKTRMAIGIWTKQQFEHENHSRNNNFKNAHTLGPASYKTNSISRANISCSMNYMKKRDNPLR